MQHSQHSAILISAVAVLVLVTLRTASPNG
jgi:hypothetical protein